MSANHDLNRQRGAALIEVSLAMAVGITLIAAAAIGVQKNRDREQSRELGSEEQLIFASADAYYRASCLSGALPANVTVATLLSQGFLPRAARPVWGATWSVTYFTGPRRAQVSAILSNAPASLIPWISEYAGADVLSGSTVSWIHNIRIAVDTSSASALEFKAMYETSTC